MGGTASGTATGATTGAMIAGPIGAGVGALAGYFLSRGGPADSGQIKGSGYFLKDTAEKELSPWATDVRNMGWPQLQQYSGWLNALRAPNSSARMAAAAPLYSDIRQQRDAQLRQAEAMKRGGSQTYMRELINADAGGKMSDTMNKLYTMAQEKGGQLGEWTSGLYLDALSRMTGMEGTSANILTGQQDRKAIGQQAMTETIQKIAAQLAESGVFG